MAVTRIRGLTQIQSSSIEPAQLSQSIAGNGVLLTNDGGIHFDENYAPTFSRVYLNNVHGQTSHSVIEGYVTIEGYQTLKDHNGVDRNFGLVVENDITASHIFSEFLEVSSSAIVSSGSNIFGSDVGTHIHEFTGSIYNTGSLTVDGPVTITGATDIDGNTSVDGDLTVRGTIEAEKYIVSSSEVNVVKSSVSGSSTFGDTPNDIHAFTGSVKTEGGFTLTDAGYEVQGLDFGGSVGSGYISSGQIQGVITSQASNGDRLSTLNAGVPGTGFLVNIGVNGSGEVTGSDIISKGSGYHPAYPGNYVLSASAYSGNTPTTHFTASINFVKAKTSMSVDYISADGGGLTNIQAAAIQGTLSQWTASSTDGDAEVGRLGDVSITGSLRVSNNLYAAKLITEVTQSSILYTSGSTKFGDSQDDTHQFTGSVSIKDGGGDTVTITDGDIVATSFTGDGSGLTSVPAASVTGLNLDTIGDSDTYVSASKDGGDGHLQIVSKGASAKITVTGSMELSQSITLGPTASINAGDAAVGGTTKEWGDSNLAGSYFANWDSNTKVSTMLRFFAGALSSSVADNVANTYTLNTLTHTVTNPGSSTSKTTGRIPQVADGESRDSSNIIQNLIDRGFAQNGSILINDSNVVDGFKDGDDITRKFSSNRTGTDSGYISTLNDGFGLGRLNNGSLNTFYVSCSMKMEFYESKSLYDAGTNPTFTTHSAQIFSLSTTDTDGDSNGLKLCKIPSSQPALLDSTFQEAQFDNVEYNENRTNKDMFYHASNTSFTSLDSAGWYKFLPVDIAIASASGGTYPADGAAGWTVQTVSGNTLRKYSPTITISDTQTITSTQAFQTASSSPHTFTKLSGAPYVRIGQYDMEVTASNVFSPLYSTNTSLSTTTFPSIGGVNLAPTWENGYDATLTIASDGTINDSDDRVVFSSDGAHTRRASGTVPYKSDEIRIGALWVANNLNVTNMNMTRADLEGQAGNDNFGNSYGIRVRDKGNSQNSVLTWNNLKYAAAGAGSYPVESGSIAYYGIDLTQTTQSGHQMDYFLDELYRCKLNAEITGGAQYNDVGRHGVPQDSEWNSEDELGQYDLQVKPGYADKASTGGIPTIGYLVNPGGDNGYWWKSGYGNSTYKYFARAFKANGDDKGGIQDFKIFVKNTNDSAVTIVPWSSTTADTISIALFLEGAGKDGQGGRIDGTSNRGILYDLCRAGGYIDDVSAAQNPFPTADKPMARFGTDNATGTNGGKLTDVNRTAAGPQTSTDPYTSTSLTDGYYFQVSFLGASTSGATIDADTADADSIVVLVRYNGTPTYPIRQMWIEDFGTEIS